MDAVTPAKLQDGRLWLHPQGWRWSEYVPRQADPRSRAARAELYRETELFIAAAERTSMSVSAVEIAEQSLRPLVDGYVQMLSSAAVAAKDLLGVLDSAGDLSDLSDLSCIVSPIGQVGCLGEPFEDAIVKLKRACAGASFECDKIGEAMEQTMNNQDPKRHIGETLKAHSSRMKAIQPEERDVELAHGAYIEKIDDHIEFITTIEKIEHARTNIDIAIRQEEQLLAPLMAACRA